jgi:hypothetical protein
LAKPKYLSAFRFFEGIRELETPAVIDAINTGGKHRSTCRPSLQPARQLLAVICNGQLQEYLSWPLQITASRD